jgi:Xaa-Pro dipeptidase
MKSVEPGQYEYEVKALFDYYNRKHGLLKEAYNGIHATGKNSAILHYVNCNSQREAEDLFLIDAGYEYKGYSSDFTRTFPADGSFSELQAGIYESVLNAQKEVLNQVEAGVKMEDLHLQSARVILKGLKQMDLVYGDIEELMEQDIFALFYPHGLGHFLGLDTHDVGGYPKGVDRIDRPGLKYLRVRRTLEPSMVLTVEPGCYIIPALLEPAFNDESQSQYLNEDKLRSMFEFGGVRIEDNIIVEEEGYENMTDVPKEISAIEKLMNS